MRGDIYGYIAAVYSVSVLECLRRLVGGPLRCRLRLEQRHTLGPRIHMWRPLPNKASMFDFEADEEAPEIESRAREDTAGREL